MTKLNQKLIDYAQEVLLPLGCKVARFRNTENVIVSEYNGNILDISIDNDFFNFRAVFKHNEKYARFMSVFSNVENPDAHEMVIGSLFYSQNAKVVQAFDMFENIEDYMIGKNMNFLIQKASKPSSVNLSTYEISDVVELDNGYLVYVDTDLTSKAVFVSKDEVIEQLGKSETLSTERDQLCVQTQSNQSDEVGYTPVEMFIDNNLNDILKGILNGN